jgi:hypothetical protein
MSKAHLGKRASEETKVKMRKPKSEETKEKIRKSMMGKNTNPTYIQTEEHKKNVSKAIKAWWDKRKEVVSN